MMFEPSFSVCIPNYNYARYLGETIESVLTQSYQNFEIVVADNASTDNSVAVAKSFGDRVRVIENAYNVGFAPNLDRATFSARRDFMIVLSSDDVMRPNALERYAEVLSDLGQQRAHRAVLTSATDVIDGDGQMLAVHYRPPGKYFYEKLTLEDSAAMDWNALPVDRAPAEDVLREALKRKDNPGAFLATCYPRKLYEQVEGYNSGFRMWPDHHFLLKLLSQEGAEMVYVPQRLFGYRVHNYGQGPAELRSGAIKYQLDSYLHTLEFPQAVLEKLGLHREELVDVFVEKAVMERGLQAMAANNRERALKCLAFGFATYPKKAASEPKTYALAGLLAMGPAGGWLASRLYDWHLSRKGARRP